MRVVKSKKDIQFDRYKHYAEQAAKAESEGKYSEAAKLWKTAQQMATGSNFLWSQARAKICEHCIKRPSFRVENQRI